MKTYNYFIFSLFVFGDYVLEDLLDKKDIERVLLIDPAFPIANKSRNHKDLLPVGLLKISTYLKSRGIKTTLIRLNNHESFDDFILNFNPDLVMITSVFTYWFDEVKEAVDYSKKLLPKIPIIVGGVLASLLPEVCKKEFDCYIQEGVIGCAEHLKPDYSLLENKGEDINFQIIHSSRGCKRKCGFCGVYKIEPHFLGVSSIKDEIIRKNLVFYDNNFLRNPHVETLLNELIELKKEKKITKCESQSGFDGRILRRNPDLAKLLKEANFKDPKIAWDGPYKAYENRAKEIQVLEDAGYSRKEIAVFMIYNHDELDYNELEDKRAFLFNQGVQVSDCRYRPLDRLDDGYNPHARKPQTNEEYHISPNWTDEEVRQFRRNVRRHNICIRHGMKYHSRMAERKKISKEESMKVRELDYDDAKKILKDAWNPAEAHHIKKESKQTTLI